MWHSFCISLLNIGAIEKDFRVIKTQKITVPHLVILSIGCVIVSCPASQHATNTMKYYFTWGRLIVSSPV